MKLSRSISSRRWRMNASVDLSSGITRYSSAFTRRFTFSISSMRRRIVVSISAATTMSSTSASYASAASSIRAEVVMIPYPRSSSFLRTLFASIFGTMIPITFFVLSYRVGTSLEASAADRTPMDPSIARAIAIRCSATRYLSARFDRSVFARSSTRKNSTISASRFSFSSRWPRSAMRRVRRSWRSWDRVGLYSARTILRAHLRRTAVLRMVLLERLAVDLREPSLVQRREEFPTDLEGVDDAPVLLGALADELLLESVGELEHLPIALGERLLPDDRDEAPHVLALRVRGVELVRHLLVVLPRPVLPDPGVHEPREGWQRVDRRVDPLAVQLPVHGDLSLRDVAGQVGDRMGPVVVGDRHDGNLRDGTRPALDAARAFVDRCEVRVRVPGIAAAPGHLLPRRPDLTQRLRVVRHVGQDGQDVHADLVREEFRRREGHARRDEPLDGRVVREVQEQDRAFERPRPFEIVHEHPGLLVRDAHRREDDAERLLAPEDLRLPGDLERDVVVRQPRTREQRELLTPHERVQPVDRRDAGLDELRGVLPRVRVDGGALDLDPLLRDDRRSSVRGFAGPREDAAEHFPRDGQLDGLPEELDARCAVDSGSPLEDLHDDDTRRGIEDLAPFAPAVRQVDLDEFVVPDGLRLLDEDERSRDLRDRAVLLRHSARLQALEVVVHHRERLLKLLIELLLVLDAREELAALDARDVLHRHVEGERLLPEVRVLADRRDELVLPRWRAERVDRVVGVLLQEDLADHPGDLERELLLRGERVRADQPHDLLEFRLLLERPLRPLPQLRPLLVDLRPEPILQGVAVQAVGREPVDRREMSPRAQRGVERLEHLHDSQGALGDRLGKVAAARRDRADDGDRGIAVVQRRHATGALVELAESGRQVSGKAFFSGHLLEAARDFPHRLGPPRRGVGHEGHVVSHVSVVLRKRHPRVHGRLSRRNGHVARVRD